MSVLFAIAKQILLLKVNIYKSNSQLSLRAAGNCSWSCNIICVGL